YRAAVIVHGILQRLAHQAFSTFERDRLDTNTAVLGEADLGDAHFLGEELDDFLGFGRARLPLYPGIDVFGVLAENHHVDVTGLLHRARHALEPPHRPLAHIKVEFLARRHVERADATADR